MKICGENCIFEIGRMHLFTGAFKSNFLQKQKKTLNHTRLLNDNTENIKLDPTFRFNTQTAKWLPTSCLSFCELGYTGHFNERQNIA